MMNQGSYLESIPENSSDIHPTAPRLDLLSGEATGRQAFSDVASSVRGGPISSVGGVVSPGPLETARPHTKREFQCHVFLRRHFWVLMTALLIFGGVVVAIVVIASKTKYQASSGTNDEAGTANGAPSAQPTTTVVPETPNNETIAKLDEIFAGVSLDDDLNNEGSAAFKARHWMLYEDLLRDDVVDDGNYFVTQRYVMAHIYFSLGGDHWVSPDDESTNGYLLPDETECNWDGVVCSEAEEQSLRVISVNLTRRNLTGLLPMEMSHLTRLQKLDLSSNNISGAIQDAFFSKHESLYLVDLTNNSFTGRIPSSIWSLPALTKLYISDNSFSGPITLDEYAIPSGLKKFWLSHNAFSGGLPSWFSELQSLKEFEAVNSNLNGELPEFVPRSLVYLNLYWNSLTGTLPENYLTNSHIKWLYLDANGLTGPLPNTEAANASSLRHVFLDRNNFTDTLPDKFGLSWNELEQLHLQENQHLVGTLGPTDDSECYISWPNLLQLQSDCVLNCPCCTACLREREGE